jgi:ankyrin repeat protein
MKYNQTDLFYAINSNNLSLVENVLEHVDITRNEFYDGTITFVTLAVLNRHDLILKKLIEHGADINKLSYLDYNWPSQAETFNNLETALVTATRHGFTEICAILLEHNAKLNKIDSFNMSALHWAVSLNFPDIVFSLLKHNANPHLKDANNESPLEMAIKNGQMNIVALFAENCVLDYKYREYLLCAIKTSNNDIFR